MEKRTAPEQIKAPTTLTLVVGANALARETAISARLESSTTIANAAVIAEGSCEHSPLEAGGRFPHLQIMRIAPGCPCCSGNLVMRVTLNRVLRQSPDTLFISLADSAHLMQIRQFLSQEPYAQFLSLTKEWVVSDR